MEVVSQRLDEPGLLDTWRDLQARGAVTTPFSTWQWAEALRVVPAVSAAVHVLRVTRGGRTLGLLALERWRDEERLRVLGPAGGRWLAPDHVDVVAEPGDRPVVAVAVARYLARREEWDLLDLEGLSREGALAAALDRQWLPRAARLPARAVPSPYVDLRSRDPAKLLPSRNLRQQVGRGYRTAARTGGGLTLSTTPRDVVAALPELMRLHQERFAGVSQVFATPQRRTFHLEAAGRLADAGMARVYRLEADGVDAALLYAFRLGDRLYYYSLGMRPDVGLSPGRTLLGQSILSAAEEGLAEFDLLRGEHAFKLRFASGTRQDLHVRLLRPGVRSLASVMRRVPGRVSARLRGEHPEETRN